MSSLLSSSSSSLSSNNNNDGTTKRSHVIVIVLGDIGRSPRMQYHTISLLEQNIFDVTLIGYTGEELVPFLHSYNNTNNNNNKPKLTVVRFLPPSFRFILDKVPILYFVWRTISLSIVLLYILVTSIPIVNNNNNNNNGPDCILVQNPPAIPLLVVVFIYKKLILFLSWIFGKFYYSIKKEPTVIIDWHNLGYSMLHPGSKLQQIAKRYELYIAPIVANGHFTVTNAMKEYIVQNVINVDPNNSSTINNNNNVSVLYDCPPALFRPLDVSEQHEILSKLHTVLCQACPKSWGYETTSIYNSTENNIQKTIFTELDTKTNEYRPRLDRPALVTSSTSWTPDEDFSILLQALVQLEDRICLQQQSQLKVIVIVTGKGPQRDMYMKQICQLQLTRIAIETVWLEPSDYPKLLACADIGVSLHTSTSNLDLPMKVLDLYGCYIPVCAYDYPCLAELVQDNVNGRTFTTSTQLSEQLYDLLSPLADTTTNNNNNNKHNHSYGKLNDYSQNLINRNRWDTNWIENALPMIQQLTQQQQQRQPSSVDTTTSTSTNIKKSKGD